MSVAPEATSDLPGFRTIKREFQKKEDAVLAHRLQEKEYDDHFNANVQLRRTARYDSSVANVLQKEENKLFQEELEQRNLKEEHDRRVAQHIHEEASKEEQRQREMEEETARVALSLQDEEVARNMQEREDHKFMKQKRREEMDEKLARQVSIEEQRRMLKQKEQREREQQLSEQLIRRMQLEENPPPRDEDDVTNDECLALRLHQQEMEIQRKKAAEEKRRRELEDERVTQMIQGQRQRPSNSSSLSSPQSPPTPTAHPFNPSSGSQQSPVDVTQSLSPRGGYPSAGSHPLNHQQQQPVQAEQSLPPRGSVDSAPTKQALNYKRASSSTKKGVKSTIKKK